MSLHGKTVGVTIRRPNSATSSAAGDSPERYVVNIAATIGAVLLLVVLRLVKGRGSW